MSPSSTTRRPGQMRHFVSWSPPLLNPRWANPASIQGPSSVDLWYGQPLPCSEAMNMTAILHILAIWPEVSFGKYDHEINLLGAPVQAHMSQSENNFVEFSPSTFPWVLGIELRCSDLHSKCFTHCAILLGPWDKFYTSCCFVCPWQMASICQMSALLSP